MDAHDQKSQPQEPLLLTLAEASALLHIPEATLHGWAWAGKIPCVRLGRKRMFRRVDLEDWIDKHLCPVRPQLVDLRRTPRRTASGGSHTPSDKEGK